MNGAAKDFSLWTKRRFWGVIGVLFVLQVGLILLFGDRSRAQPLSPPPPVRFRALGASVSEDQLLRQFFVGDPAVFPLPNPHGFSGRGWLNQGPLVYSNECPLKAPIWLELDAALLRTEVLAVPAPLSQFGSNLVAGLGTNFPSLPTGHEAGLSGLAEQQARREEPLPVFLSPEIIQTQSLLRLDGGLEDRLWRRASILRSWSNDKPLGKSVVQIAVNPEGEVVAARLAAGCGLAEADAEAVAVARSLRFSPARKSTTRWSDAYFQWQTTEPPAVNPPK